MLYKLCAQKLLGVNSQTFLDTFERYSKAKTLLCRERAKLVLEALQDVGLVTAAEISQIKIHSDSEKIAFWFYFFYSHQDFFRGLSPEERAVFFQFAQRKYAVNEKGNTQYFKSLSYYISRNKIDILGERELLFSYISEPSMQEFSMILYRRYRSMGSMAQRELFLYAMAEAKQMILSGKNYTELVAFLKENKQLRFWARPLIFSILLQVFPLHSLYLTPVQAKKIFTKALKHEKYLQNKLIKIIPDCYDEHAGQSIKVYKKNGSQMHEYQLGLNIWLSLFGGPADICTAPKANILWADPEFMLLTAKRENEYIGFYMVRVLQQGSERILLLCGSEPTEAYVTGKRSEEIFSEVLEVLVDYAKIAGIDTVAQAGCSAWYSNRLALRDYLEKKLCPTLPIVHLNQARDAGWGYLMDKYFILWQAADQVKEKQFSRNYPAVVGL